MKYLLLLNLLTFLALPSEAEEISYSIYSLPLFVGEKKHIESDTLQYSINEVTTKPGPIVNVANEVKSIWLNDSFAISYTSLPEEKAPDGFGLTLSKDRKGFSWEWFRRFDGDIFDKLQGSGNVEAVFIENEDRLIELSSVKVLEKIILRVNTLWWLPFWNGDTHHIEVKAGSTLVFATLPNVTPTVKTSITKLANPFH